MTARTSRVIINSWKIMSFLEYFQAVPMDNIKSAEQAGMLIGESNGMYYVETGTYNTMIVGAPRSGKGECYVLPSMRLMANSKNKPSLIITI